MALKPKITRKLLEEKVGSSNVFHFYFGPYELGKSYKSVFRDEQRASTWFKENEHGHVIYSDFATGEFYDFIGFVKRLFGITFYKALERIAIDFGLIPGERSSTKPALIQVREKAENKPKKSFIIDCIPFNKQHLKWWAQYGITKEELIAADIKAVAGVKIGDFDVPLQPLRFLYVFDKEHFKLYTPYSEDYKWISSVPLNIPFGMTDLKCTHDTLIITKSVKDCLVLRKFFPEVIGVQNEGSGALKKETARALKKCYKRIIVWFDCDRPGIKAANYYKKTYGFEPYFTGDTKRSLWQNVKLAKKRGVKDPADFVKHFNLPIFAQYLKHIKLL